MTDCGDVKLDVVLRQVWQVGPRPGAVGDPLETSTFRKHFIQLHPRK